MKRTFFPVAFAAALTVLTCPAAAQQADDESLVPLFLETCTRGGVNGEAILAGIPTAGNWSELPEPTVEISALAQVPGGAAQADVFRGAESVRQWQRDVNGRRVSVVFATFPETGRYRHVCALIVPDVRNAGPYFSSMREGIESLGLSGRSTDLPHFQEYAGRLADRRRARADIFSRSRVVAGARSMMHMYIAFEATPPS